MTMHWSCQPCKSWTKRLHLVFRCELLGWRLYVVEELPAILGRHLILEPSDVSARGWLWAERMRQLAHFWVGEAEDPVNGLPDGEDLAVRGEQNDL